MTDEVCEGDLARVVAQELEVHAEAAHDSVFQNFGSGDGERLDDQ